jgi:serine/threonine-protein kinase
MAPEQVDRRRGIVGPAADVYGLGAVLYEMLTGRPPFRGDSSAETTRQVLSDEPVPPSRLNGRVPRDLSTVCMKCLEKDPQHRYATAAALSADIDRFRRGKPIAARPARFPERAVKWARRHPSDAGLMAGSTAVVCLVLMAGLWLGFQRDLVARSVDHDLRELARHQAQGDWTSARTALERAQARLAGSGAVAVPAALRDRVSKSEADLRLVSRLSATLLERAVVVNGRFDVRYNKARAERGYEAAFRDAGLLVVGEKPAAAASRIAASNVREPLLAALDDWAFCASHDARRDWLLSVGQLADYDPTGRRHAIRDPAAWREEVAFRQIPDLALNSGASVQLLVAIGERFQELDGDAIPYLTRLQQRHPGDFWSNHALGEALRKRRSPEAIRYFQAAIGAWPDAAVTYNNLGICLVEHGRMDEATDYFRMALNVDGDYAPAHDNLGIRLHAIGDFEGAIGHFRAALRNEPGRSGTHNNLGLSLVRIGRTKEAIDEYRHAVRIDPDNGPAYNNLGILLRDGGHTAEAADSFAHAVRLAPEDGPSRNNLGIALRDLGRTEEAVTHFRVAVRIDGDNADIRNNLGLALRDLGKAEDALAEFMRSLGLRPGYAAAHANAGIALSKLGRVDEAIEHFTKAVTADDSDAGSHHHLGIALLGKGRLADATAHFRRAVQLQPKVQSFRKSLGVALRDADHVGEATSEFREAVRLDPKDPAARKLLEASLRASPGAN